MFYRGQRKRGALRHAPEQIATNRLVLRKPRRDDAEAIFSRYASDPGVTRLVGWPRHASLESSLAFIEFSDSEWARWPAGPYLVVAREGGRLLGGTGFGFETPHRASTGYVLATDAWGKGVATEALRAVVDLAPDLGIVRLYALCHPENGPSLRVLEKGGFLREGLLRRHSVFPNLGPDEPLDVYCYARTFDRDKAPGPEGSDRSFV